MTSLIDLLLDDVLKKKESPVQPFLLCIRFGALNKGNPLHVHTTNVPLVVYLEPHGSAHATLVLHRSRISLVAAEKLETVT